ncbi:MAG TPA: preprotein translocase subunit SecE [Acidobacteriaceae bacterium]|nr:preprotein translocase subunit SecE [Acidobacteriaceae bacterium]
MQEQQGGPTRDAGIVQAVRNAPEFIASVRQEVKLVERPAWQEVRSTTVVVFVFLMLFLLYFFILDRIFSGLYRWFERTVA